MDVNFILNNYYLKRKINVPRGTLVDLYYTKNILIDFILKYL